MTSPRRIALMVGAQEAYEKLFGNHSSQGYVDALRSYNLFCEALREDEKEETR